MSEYCVIKTIVKDGVIVRTEKADYTGPEADQGFICQKGIASARNPYSPQRLLYPMKRVGACGDGKWQRISWEQALDEIAAKVIELRQKYGPQSIVRGICTAARRPPWDWITCWECALPRCWVRSIPALGTAWIMAPSTAAFLIWEIPLPTPVMTRA